MYWKPRPHRQIKSWEASVNVIARGLRLTANRFDIEPEITVNLLNSGVRIIELPVTFSPRSRQAGKKIRWRDGWHAVDLLVRHRFGRSRS